MIKIAFFDVDGTILPKGSRHIPISTVQTIQKMREKGILIFLATGRHPSQLKELPMDEIEIDGFVTMEGAYCYTPEKMIYGQPLDVEDCEKIVQIVEEDPFPIIFADGEKMWINLVNDHVRSVHERLNAYIPEIREIQHVFATPIYMMIIYCTKAQKEKVLTQTTNTKLTWWDSDSAADLVHIGAGKDHGVKAVLEYYGISMEDAIAFGDGANDMPLLEACGIKVAMGNALEELKQKADYVTACDTDDGIYKAAQYYGIIE